MPNTNVKYWQQSCGDGDRVYYDICFKFEVILNGPGYAGLFDNESIEQMKSDGLSSKKNN